MSAFNVVRFRVKSGCEQQFIDVHRSIRPEFKGYLGGDLIRTGDQTFCVVGKWRNMDAIVAARPEMIAVLDRLRDLLEDLGGDLGVTDPVSGESVASFAPTPKQPKKKAKNKKKKKNKKNKREQKQAKVSSKGGKKPKKGDRKNKGKKNEKKNKKKNQKKKS